MNRKAANQYSPLTLAFLGDAVYEQLVREKLVLESNMPTGKLHKLAVERVRAKYQSAVVETILPLLNEDETAVFKRGRNARGGNVPKSASQAEYSKATALEALFGYLYLSGDTERIRELFTISWNPR